MNLRHCNICGGTAICDYSAGLAACRGCGVIYKPDPGSAASVYWTPEGKRKYFAAKEKLFRAGLNWLAARLPRLGVLLDVGCAEGEFMAMAARAGWNVEGIETDPLLAAAAQGEGFEVGTIPVEDAKFSGEFYDAVTAYEVFSQMSAPRAAAEAVFKALKPGGAVYVREFNANFHMAALWLEKKTWFSGLGLKPGILHDFNFRPCTMRLMLESAGFRDVKIWNSAPTEGDPYRTAAGLWQGLAGALKYLYYIAAEVLYILTFGRILAGSAFIATGRK